jgi:hypothetical protein
MKSQADKGRTERVFEAGDKVFLKLQPYLQSSVAFRANHKLAFKFYGPFEIEQKVGTVAYKLKLPANSLIHPVIHVSQLKKCVPSNRVEAAELPDEPPDFQEPEKILARRSRSLGSSTVREGLIRWTGMADTLATWENLQELRHRFPSAPAWGQAGSEERGMLRTCHAPPLRHQARHVIERSTSTVHQKSVSSSEGRSGREEGPPDSAVQNGRPDATVGQSAHTTLSSFYLACEPLGHCFWKPCIGRKL